MKSGCALKKKLKLPTRIVRLIIYLVKTKMLLNSVFISVNVLCCFMGSW